GHCGRGVPRKGVRTQGYVFLRRWANAETPGLDCRHAARPSEIGRLTGTPQLVPAPSHVSPPRPRRRRPSCFLRAGAGALLG
ncbi:hypothetical protein P7K49_005675, partial [Saguinus oedipus]